jgi:hypothetical protein
MNREIGEIGESSFHFSLFTFHFSLLTFYFLLPPASFRAFPRICPLSLASLAGLGLAPDVSPN